MLFFLSKLGKQLVSFVRRNVTLHQILVWSLKKFLDQFPPVAGPGTRIVADRTTTDTAMWAHDPITAYTHT